MNSRGEGNLGLRALKGAGTPLAARFLEISQVCEDKQSFVPLLGAKDSLAGEVLIRTH